MSIALQCAQAIAILQQVVPLGWGCSLLPYIIANALLSLANLWQMIWFFRFRYSLLSLFIIL
jgi:hypothetical protein